MILLAGRRCTHALEPSIAAEPKEAQQESPLQSLIIKGRANSCTREVLRKTDPQIRLLEHVQQTRQGPAASNLCLELSQVGWIGSGVHLGDLHPALGALQNLDARVLRHPFLKCLRWVVKSAGRSSSGLR